jgi:hypothetical protein
VRCLGERSMIELQSKKNIKLYNNANEKNIKIMRTSQAF